MSMISLKPPNLEDRDTAHVVCLSFCTCWKISKSDLWSLLSDVLIIYGRFASDQYSIPLSLSRTWERLCLEGANLFWFLSHRAYSRSGNFCLHILQKWFLGCSVLGFHMIVQFSLRHKQNCCVLSLPSDCKLLRCRNLFWTL